MMRTGAPGFRMHRPINRIRSEDSAEEQDLLRHEHPHAERRRLMLLAKVLEVVLKEGVVGMCMRLVGAANVADVEGRVGVRHSAPPESRASLSGTPDSRTPPR